MFGNRGGCMHREKHLIGRPWTNERWICCLLEFKGRHREVMAENRYTELFFLDEATAFAAGHRPCMECRRTDANRFIDAWSRAHLGTQRVKSVSHIDQVAHRERIDPTTKQQRTSRAQLSTIPDGAFVTIDSDAGQPLLVRRGKLLPWSFAGYGPAIAMPPDQAVTLLTPGSFAIAFSAGYEPAVHPSANTI